MENFNFTFSPSEDETKGLIPRSLPASTRVDARLAAQ